MSLLRFKNVNVYVCERMCVQICVCVYMHVCMCVQMCVCMHAYVCKMCLCTSECVRVCVCACVCAGMSVSMEVRGQLSEMAIFLHCGFQGSKLFA